MVISMVGIGIASADIFLISFLAKLAGGMSGMAAMFLLPYSAWVAVTNAAHSGYQAVVLRILPDIPPALTPLASGVFDPDLVPRVDIESPMMSSKVMDYGKNQQALRTHIAYLGDVQQRAIDILKKAPELYKADQVMLEAQQLVLYRMAHQAAVFARKFEKAFPKLRADLASVPQPKSVSIPPAPKVETLKNFDQRQKNFLTGVGRAVGQSVNQGSPIGAVVALVAAVAVSAVVFQKSVRAMEVAHGELKTYLNRAADDLAVLGIAHAQLLSISTEIFRQSTELRRLLLWAKDAQDRAKLKAGSLLTDDEQHNVKLLMSYAILSRLQTAQSV